MLRTTFISCLWPPATVSLDTTGPPLPVTDDTTIARVHALAVNEHQPLLQARGLVVELRPDASSHRPVRVRPRLRPHPRRSRFFDADEYDAVDDNDVVNLLADVHHPFYDPLADGAGQGAFADSAQANNDANENEKDGDEHDDDYDTDDGNDDNSADGADNNADGAANDDGNNDGTDAGEHVFFPVVAPVNQGAPVEAADQGGHVEAADQEEHVEAADQEEHVEATDQGAHVEATDQGAPMAEADQRAPVTAAHPYNLRHRTAACDSFNQAMDTPHSSKSYFPPR